MNFHRICVSFDLVSLTREHLIEYCRFPFDLVTSNRIPINRLFLRLGKYYKLRWYRERSHPKLFEDDSEICRKRLGK